MQKKDKEPDHIAIMQAQIKQLQLGKHIQPDQLKQIGMILESSLLSIKKKVNTLRNGKQKKKQKIKEQDQKIQILEQKNACLQQKNKDLYRAVEEKHIYIKKREADFMKTKESLWQINAKLKQEIIELKSEIYEKDEKIEKLILLNKINVSFASSKQFRESLSNIQDSQQDEEANEAQMSVYVSQKGEQQVMDLSSQISQIEMKEIMKNPTNETCDGEKLQDVINKLI